MIWGFIASHKWFSSEDVNYLSSLPHDFPRIEWVWEEMDRVWNELMLDNSKPLSSSSLGVYYSHPVWLMNGIFTAMDPVSIEHRKAIAQYLSQVGVKSIADYGGGFGELALALAKNITDAKISIIEPYPSRVGIERMKDEDKINIVSELEEQSYESIIAQDVLEHVEDPVNLACQIAESVCDDGLIIFANCFHPFIQCHLPSTFHLRHTFPYVMKALGLQYKGTITGASHAQIYQRIVPLDLGRARRAERLSKYVYPLLNSVWPILARVRALLIRR